MEVESRFGTDASRRTGPMGPRTAEERTLLAVPGNRKDGSSIREKLFGAWENTPLRGRAWGTSRGRN
jgi:hypothetical protein